MAEERVLDPFDVQYGQIVDLPDSLKTYESIVRETDPLVGVTQTFIIQTVRRAGLGDFIFLEVSGRDRMGSDRLVRLVLGPKVAARIASQRDSLTTQGARLQGKRAAEAAKLRGEKPGFLLTPAEREERKRARELKAAKLAKKAASKK